MTGRRAEARQRVLAEITAEAWRQLARDGAAALSLRSVARELGMVSSAVYRYVASRDELLTILIVEGYGELADALEGAVAATERSGAPPRDRWAAVCGALRRWAIDHPHAYALLYGSPVPGYAAPPDTIVQARRVYAALADPVRVAGGRRRRRRDVPAALVADAERLAAELDLPISADVAVRLLGSVAQLFGLVSLELFGHTHGVIGDHDAFFADRVDAMADDLGL